MSMNINWKLPEDIVKVIFSKLPFSNLPNLRIVCKAWNDLVLDYAISSSKFHNAFILSTSDVVPNTNLCNYDNAKMHCIDSDTNSSIATLSFGSVWKFVIILNSCNGLLYIYKSAFHFWCTGIWNPMTNEFFQLPDLEEYIFIYLFGFGFSPTTKHYKLFRIFKNRAPLRESTTTIEVLRFGIDKELQWRGFGCQPPFRIINHGTYFDGVIYWIGNNITKEVVIYGLDVETETFETIVVLNIGPYSPTYHVETQPFNDTICAFIIMPGKRQVWVMKAKHLWIIEFVIDLSYPLDICLIIAPEDEGKLYFISKNDLFCFDKTRKMTKIKTLFNSNDIEVLGFLPIQSFNFGSLPNILAGND